MKLKICRVTDLQTAIELVRAGVDYLGFHDLQDTNTTRTAQLVGINRKLREDGFDGGVLLTKVTDIGWISQVASCGRYPLVQLHRQADLAEIEELSGILHHTGSSLVQVVDPYLHHSDTVHKILEHARYVLYDNYVGGTGQRLADSYLDSMPMERAFLAGGIDDLRASQLQSRYRPYAIDVQSWVERRDAGGRREHSKDMDRVSQLVEIARREP